jgi:DNA-binding transcriptional ArsR family regulator
MNLKRDVFQAIADRQEGYTSNGSLATMTAGAIASNFDTARPTVSKHLQILPECELLEQKKRQGNLLSHQCKKYERSS